MTDAGNTYPDGEPTDAQAAVAAIDWDARLRDAVAATLAARDRRRNQRVVLARNRDWGLQQRHRTKLDRTQNNHGSQQ